MGFSFRSLYTDGSASGQESASVSSVPSVEPVSLKNQPSPAPGKKVMARPRKGIPGPLAIKKADEEGAGHTHTELSQRESGFCSLDSLEPSSPSQAEVESSAPVVADALSGQGSSSAQAQRSPGKCLPGQSSEAQITLSALFAASGPFELQDIITRTAGLPGIAACLVKTPAQLLLADSNRSGVRQISESLDLPRIEAFQAVSDLLEGGSLHGMRLYTDSGLVSCFSSGNITLMVRHEGEDMQSGLWEKLLLVTRAIAVL